jgi:N-acetylmuramoyl-L-alanine amidase
MRFMIDAGHSLYTVGKRCPDDSMREFHFNSVVAKYVIEELDKYENVECFIAHDPTGNVDIPLKERTNRANELKVDCYISIHANAFGTGWNNTQGIETFVYVTKPPKALELAANVQNHLIRDTGRPNRGVKTANFHVLRETKMTAILIECGFMTNKEEAALLKSDKYRRTVAKAIVKGVVQTYKLKKKETVQVAYKKEDDITGHWAEQSIRKAMEKGVMKGYGNNEFRPNEPVTRGQLAVILDRLGLLDK